MTTYAVVGRPVTRQEGPDKVSGTFLYAADVALPGMIWGKVLRSPFPHARIVNIDATRALGLAGVRAVITGKDTAGMRVGRMVRDVPLLAEDTVRFVGEKVAAVAAVDPDTAEEALTRIDVRASSAVSGSTAATAATFSPTKRTVSSASRGTSRTMRPTRMPAVSLPVITARTPARPRALVASILTMRAWGKGLLNTLPQIMPGRATSAAYRNVPDTLSGPSCLVTGLPTTA